MTCVHPLLATHDPCYARPVLAWHVNLLVARVHGSYFLLVLVHPCLRAKGHVHGSRSTEESSYAHLLLCLLVLVLVRRVTVTVT